MSNVPSYDEVKADPQAAKNFFLSAILEHQEDNGRTRVEDLPGDEAAIQPTLLLLWADGLIDFASVNLPDDEIILTRHGTTAARRLQGIEPVVTEEQELLNLISFLSFFEDSVMSRAGNRFTVDNEAAYQFIPAVLLEDVEGDVPMSGTGRAWINHFAQAGGAFTTALVDFACLSDDDRDDLAEEVEAAQARSQS